MTLPLAVELASARRGAAGRMSRRLTQPFAAGGDVLHLDLLPAAAPQAADVAGYDFTDHAARFGSAPTPSYILRSLTDLDRDTRVTVRVADAALPSGGADVSITFRAGTLAGESVPLPLPAGATGDARLAGISVVRRTASEHRARDEGGAERVDDRPAFAPVAGPVAQQWAISVLLGNTARVMWVLGGERDLLRRQIARTATQRQLATALGASLDLIGVDLAVPRFPPLPYSVDSDTVALYHLDDAPGAPLGAEDFTGRFPGRTGHHGTPSGSAVPGAAGRYGPAVAFAGPGAVTVASNAAFNLPAGAELTAECFVKPEPVTTPDARVLARRGASGAGWSIEVGEFGRGLPRTVRATVSDATTELVLHSDRSLPTDRFSHLALVLDRAEASVALWVDGVRADLRATAALGALTAAVPLVIGPGAGTALRATVDEVRISSIARSGFAPALGESDEHYRRRLRIFQRWVLPTPAALAEVLNDAVGAIGGIADPLVVEDVDSPVTFGRRLVRVVPAALAPGQSIDASGRRGVIEDDLYGDPDDLGIDPALLLRHDRPEVDYGPVTGGDPHLMQPPLARSIDELVALAGPGRVRVDSAWIPGAPDARAAGRGVTLGHSVLGAARLAALAHRAGFALVTTLPRAAGVYASCTPGSPVVLGAAGAELMPGELPVEVGTAITLSALPVPPSGAELHWSVAGGGPGRVRLSPSAIAGQATLDGLDPGVAVVSLDVSHGGFSATASVAVRVLPATVAAGSAIAEDGTLGASPLVAGEPAERFDPALLDTVTDARAAFSAADARRMQRGLSRRLITLLDDLAAAGPGTLTVQSAFRPVAAGAPATLASQGRALTLIHSTVSAGRLAAMVHAVGFSRVAVTGAGVEVLHRAEDLITVQGPELVEEGESIGLHVEPDPAAVSATTRLSWSSGAVPPTSGQADVTTTLQPAIQLLGRRAGWVWVQAALREAGANGPYAMQVRLRAAVPAGASITRDQYDLIMNVVHALHPMGVEVLTRGIRPAVVELAGSSALDPDYTYPKFRLHRSAARLRKDAQHG